MIIRLTLLERLLHRLHLLPTPIVDAFGSIVFGRVLAIAVRRGLFEALVSAPRSADNLATATQLDRQALGLLLQSLALAGYIKAGNGVYRLTGESRKWLVKGSPHYLGNLIRYFETLCARWAYLEHSLERGMPAVRYFDTFTDDDWKAYVYGMRDLARLLLPQVLKKVAPGNSPRQLLDLGGGHGLYTIECCRRYPELSATIIDLPGALQHTRHFVTEAGMADRIRLVPADLTRTDLPSSQDCVLMFNVIHGFTKETNRTIIQRALGALSPGRKIYILDQLLDERRSSDLSRFIPLMVGLNLLNEIGGTTYSYAEVKDWCLGAAGIRRMRLHFPGVSLVEVRR